MNKLLVVNGSPTESSSTEILLGETADGFVAAIGSGRARVDLIALNTLSFFPCQACGKAPSPQFCFYDDALTPVYKLVEECDAFILGTPIYFDAVSAQAKSFIDRCNCFRPPDFEHRHPEYDFVKVLNRKRPGGMILVGGRDAWFEGARRTLAGFFKWIEVTNEGTVFFRSNDYTQKGMAGNDSQALAEARALGTLIAGKVLHG